MLGVTTPSYLRKNHSNPRTIIIAVCTPFAYKPIDKESFNPQFGKHCLAIFTDVYLLSKAPASSVRSIIWGEIVGKDLDAEAEEAIHSIHFPLKYKFRDASNSFSFPRQVSNEKNLTT